MAMLIAGWFSLGARERGAFGFSNEKSLMYCPSTLSDGACCCGCGVGPPLVVVILRYPPGRISAPRGVANTGGEAGQGSRKRVLALALPWRQSLAVMRLNGF